MTSAGGDDVDNPLARDLNSILERTRPLWEDLRGENLFLTGGTGFFGCWLLESLAWANRELALGARVLVLSRNPDAFRARAPRLAADPAIGFHAGDVRDFAFPPGRFPFVIHAATEASARLIAESPLRMFETIVAGTRRVLDFAAQCGAKRFLFTSSGAVYGRQPPELARVTEEYAGAPDPMDSRSAYGEGKRAAELLCALYAARFRLSAGIARCFAFVGPYLPLDAHFAVGNFIRDALRGGPIVVQGDGTPCRSYLYAADLAVWLWTILFRGVSCRPYNVGAEEPVSIRDLARRVADCTDRPIEARVLKPARPGAPAERYVPSTARAREELGLTAAVGLEEAVRRTMTWHRQRDPARAL